MKRSWIGGGILLVLLILGLLIGWGVGRTHRPISGLLQEAGDLAIAGEWAQAERCVERARREWERWTFLRECVSDQSPIETIGATMARMEVFLEERDQTEFVAACRELAFLIGTVGDAHALKMGNIL